MKQKNVNQEMFSHQGNTNQFSNSKKGVVDNWLHIPYQFQTSLSMIHHKRGSKQVLAKVFTQQHFKAHFDSFQRFWDLMEILGRFGILWDLLTVLSLLGPFGSCWNILGSFGTLSDLLRPFGTYWDLLKNFGTLGTFWDLQELFWNPQELFQNLLGPLEHFWTFQDILESFRPFRTFQDLLFLRNRLP